MRTPDESSPPQGALRVGPHGTYACVVEGPEGKLLPAYVKQGVAWVPLKRFDPTSHGDFNDVFGSKGVEQVAVQKFKWVVVRGR